MCHDICVKIIYNHLKNNLHMIFFLLVKGICGGPPYLFMPNVIPLDLIKKAIPLINRIPHMIPLSIIWHIMLC